MHYSPRKKPWFKGKIERFFRTYNKGVAHGAPGTCFSNIFDRGDYDPVRHAVVTLSTLKKISRLWVAKVSQASLEVGDGLGHSTPPPV